MGQSGSCIKYFHIGLLGRHLGRTVCGELAMGSCSLSLGLGFLSCLGHRGFLFLLGAG